MPGEADLRMLCVRQQTSAFVLKLSAFGKPGETASRTHDLPDGHGLGEGGRGAASSDVDGHHSEQHLLPNREIFHLVLGPLHEFLVRLHPLLT